MTSDRKYFNTQLSLPPLLDLTDGKKACVNIVTTKHRFSVDSAPSGNQNPVFGSEYRANGKKYHKSFGLPFLKFRQKVPVNIKFKNGTGYSFDLHLHGLSTPANTDGASS